METPEAKAAREAAEKVAADEKAAADKAAAEKAAAKPKRVQVRALIAFEDVLPNDVISVDADCVDELKAEGKVDDAPAAVAYAKSLIEG